MHPKILSRILAPCRAAAVAAAFSRSPFTSAAAGVAGPLKVGDVLKKSRRFSAEDVAAFADSSGDHNPIHFEDVFARDVAGFSGGRVVHGMLVSSIFSNIITSHFPGAIYTSQKLQFKLPVYIGDDVTAEVQAIHLREFKNRYMVKFTTKCFTNGECLVLDGEAMTILPALVPNE